VSMRKGGPGIKTAVPEGYNADPMRKLPAYLAMGLIVLGILAADAWILTRASTRRHLVETKLREFLGDQLRWGDADISLDGTVTLEETRYLTPAGLTAIAAERVAIRMGFGGIEEVRLNGFRGTLTPELIREISVLQRPDRSVRDLFPDPARLPSLRAKGGRLEVRIPDIFAGDEFQVLEIRDLLAVPLADYRYAVAAEASHSIFGVWTLRGEIDPERDTQRLLVEGRGLDVGAGWRKALAPAFREFYDHYRPEGLCDVDVEIVKSGRDAPLDVRVLLKARDMRMTFEGFPYPMAKVSGEIEFGRDGFVIKAMEGRRSGRIARFSGTAGGYDEEAPFDFRFESEPLPIDAAMLAALPDENRALVRDFAPAGRVAVRGRAVRSRGGKMRLPLDLFLEDVEVAYAGFPYRVRNLSGWLHVDGEEVRILGVKAPHGEGSVSVSGRIAGLTADTSLDLRIEAERLPLDARLKAALGAEDRAIWERFNPSGEADVLWRVRKSPGRAATHEARARCLGNQVTYKEVPLPIRDLRGEVELTGGKFRLNHVVGKAKGGEIRLDGLVADDDVSLHLDATDLPLDDQVRASLPEELTRLLTELDLSGMVSFNAGLIFRKDRRQVDLVCRLSKGGLGTELRIENVEGTVTLTGYAGADAHYIGFLNLSHATLWGKRLTDLGASFNLRGSTLGLSHLKGTAYGGMLSGRSLLANLTTKDYAAEGLVLDGLDLNEFTKDTASYADKQVGGRVRLEIPSLKGNAKDSGTASGKGRMVVRDALLWDIPLFLKFFTLNPGELLKERKQFDAGALEFEIRDRRFNIGKLALTSESVSMVGNGHIGFDGSLHVTLRPKSGPLLGIDFFILKWAGDLMSLVLGSSVKVVVTGTFEKPEVHVR
jgi:hypothetical protein